jgi:hypothetical protein
MRRLECTWQELQDLPEDYLEVWEAIWDGEEHARREQKALTAARG